MNNKFVLIAFVGLLLFLAFLFFAQPKNELEDEQEDEPAPAELPLELSLPQLSEADYQWIASRIFQNETGGNQQNLTYWGEGEDFPSFGIGHFIWFPKDVDAPFDETFPAMVAYVTQQSVQLPNWLQNLQPFDAPWRNKLSFDQALESAEMVELRFWLQQTGHLQARFIVSAFEKRWRGLDLPVEQKRRLTDLLQQMLTSAAGVFAVIDYYNFKGLGNNLRERYQNQGWGLVQVLDAMPASYLNTRDIVEQFRRSAAERLNLRVRLAPAERNEQRWLKGWMARLDGYVAE